MPPMIERKFSPIHNISLEKREDSSSSLPEISGYSAMFDEETVISTWWGDSWREVIRFGFFSPAINNKHDVRALFNHDANFLLGRTTSPKNTLRINEDKTGLFARILPPNNSIGRDVVESIERGDLSGQSFAFTIASEKWTKGKNGELDIRELITIDTLYDVGPVTYPAFEATNVSVSRSDALAQVALRSRGLQTFGESLPKSVVKEFEQKSLIQVPAGFEITSEVREAIKEVVEEILKDKEETAPEVIEPVKEDQNGEQLDTAETKPVDEQPIAEEAPKENEDGEKLESERAERIKKELALLDNLSLGI